MLAKLRARISKIIKFSTGAIHVRNNMHPSRLSYYEHVMAPLLSSQQHRDRGKNRIRIGDHIRCELESTASQCANKRTDSPYMACSAGSIQTSANCFILCIGRSTSTHPMPTALHCTALSTDSPPCQVVGVLQPSTPPAAIRQLVRRPLRLQSCLALHMRR